VRIYTQSNITSIICRSLGHKTVNTMRFWRHIFAEICLYYFWYN
jgi:hypothetical protein